MPYTKTVFVNGGPPAISAEELNKMGQGIAEAYALAERGYEITFGNGLDGNVTITSNTTLTRDMYYNNLTINSGVTLKTNGYKIFVKGTLINNGIIDNSGGNGGNGTVSAAGSAGSAGVGGGNGDSGGGGSAGTGGGGAGGSGGNGSAYGTGGSGGSSPYDNSYAKQLELIHKLYDITFGGGGGGGGGGSENAAYGGGGGGGGGKIHIYARNIVNNGTIQAKGGNGGNGYMGANKAGGGGGGGGGFVLLVYQTFTGNEPIVTGGKGGTGYQNGADGSPGIVKKIKII